MHTFHDEQYLTLVKHVLDRGVYKPDRTGTGTYSVFSYQMRFDLRDGSIPMLTSKKIHTKSIIHEILWYLQGADNIKYLKDNNVTIWDEWADENGDLGPVYGKQWRQWPDVRVRSNTQHQTEETTFSVEWNMIDQVAELIDSLKNNPNDRRMIVSAWNVGQLKDMALPPCHYAFQCYTRPLSTRERVLHISRRYAVQDMLSVPEERMKEILDAHNCPTHELSLMLNQRSCDVGLGVPFNICQYSILLRMLAEVVNMVPGEFIWNGGDVHIYANHVDGLKEQLARTPLYPSPTLEFARPVADIDDFRFEDFVIRGYKSHEKLPLAVAV
jgi:thymidylate synthase